jgi:SUMO ligase MMS21 Smc5/6 complex component
MNITRLKNFILSKIRINEGLKFNHLFFVTSEDIIIIDFSITDIKTNIIVNDTYKFNTSDDNINIITLSIHLRGVINYLNFERVSEKFYHNLSYDEIQFQR